MYVWTTKRCMCDILYVRLLNLTYKIREITKAGCNSEFVVIDVSYIFTITTYIQLALQILKSTLY